MSSGGLTPFADSTTSFPVLDGCVPASLGRRFGARALDVALGTGVGILVSLPLRLVTSYEALLAASLVVQLVAAALSVGVYIYFGTTGFLPGGRILGIRQVRVATGKAPGWAGFGKYALIGLASGPTLGIAYLVTVLLIKKPLNRGWHDNATGLVVLDVKAGRDPIENPLASTSSTIAAVEPKAAVVSVGVADRISSPAFVPSDAMSLVSPLGAPPAPSFTPPAPSFTPAAPVPSALHPVVSVQDDGMILGVPWRKDQSAPTASPPMISIREAGPAPVSPDIDLEDRTVVSLEAIAGAPGRGTLTLVSEDGQRIPLDKVTVVGRNPSTPDGYPDARTHSLPDTTMSVSKTHVILGPDPDGVWVQDLRSTNGTAITTANGMRTAVPAGGRVVAGLGALVHIGKVAFKITEQ